ncbi:MAG: phasin family protein [Azospirillaceae bacterium]
MATKQQQSNPFWDMDFTKMMAEYKVPGMDMDAIMAAQRKNFEALTQANRLAYEGMQAVATRQAEILRGAMDEMSASMREMMASGAPEEKVSRQADLMRDQFEKAIANMRELSEMIAKSNTEAADVINQRIAAQIDEMKSIAKQQK